ncbi:arrestin domain-containing protein [Blastomyces gilchristii SLH14081]|uniref:Arrestin domain-containing protein n=1 Tax=Blastomyces gilchristii (strain SLH14081) TaxID=559298 RepID=A0A179V0G2_BLAGS|nr:arrestin domain-containing protein [Blastomyces gilchristii SLH14081]OAT13816.1 arrestin domain-containing protein [Blastomyces gilchristii SLH14081]
MLLTRASPAAVDTVESVSSGSFTPTSSRSRPTSVAESLRSNTVPPDGHSQNAPVSALSLSLLRNEKVIASSNGITVSICLAEPVLFLEGFDRNDADTRKTSILRGILRLKLSKSARIKKISLNFKGMGQTNWPDGLPPKKSQLHEQHVIMNHTWMLFNAQLPAAEYSHGADHMNLKVPMVSTKELAASTIELLAKSGSATSLAKLPKEAKRLSLQSTYSRSFAKGDTHHGGPSVASRGYKLFQPGEYWYNFELPISSQYSESINSIAGWVKYTLEATIERSGAFRPNLLGHREVPFIRTPPEGSLEHVEPIAISRTWEDQLHYDIIISGKSFPLGGQVPIAFKLTPLAKVVLHRIKVIISENTQVVANNKAHHRLDTTKKVLLFEKRADAQSTSAFPGSVCRVTAGGGVAYDSRREAAEGIEYVNRRSTNLLGDLERSFEAGPTEMEFNVQLPSCAELKKKDTSHALHFDTTHEQLIINHWIKIVLRLSKLDERDPSKRRHFEISIDSPFHIMSCLATQSNLYLPAYSSPSSSSLSQSQNLYCTCKIAQQDSNTPTPPSLTRGLVPLITLRCMSNVLEERKDITKTSQ